MVGGTSKCATLNLNLISFWKTENWIKNFVRHKRIKSEYHKFCLTAFVGKRIISKGYKGLVFKNV